VIVIPLGQLSSIAVPSQPFGSSGQASRPSFNIDLPMTFRHKKSPVID
jgi:hypothetical protein